MGYDRGMEVQKVGDQKVKRGEESLENGRGEGDKDLLGSGVEYCGTCLNGVREVVGVTVVPG